MKKLLLLAVCCIAISFCYAEDGYRLWLRYDKITPEKLRQHYLQQLKNIHLPGSSASITAAKKELTTALSGLLGSSIQFNEQGNLIIGTSPRIPEIRKHISTEKLQALGSEGYMILTTKMDGKPSIIITANTDVALLYGVFNLIRLIQTNQSIDQLSITSIPKYKNRILNHWDNINRSVERGYAGISIWDWHKLPGYIDQRYIDYARANASIGINGTVLTNVNANAQFLTPVYLKKAAALADVFRPYGIKVYLTARFSAPIEIGGLKTADPLDADVQQWWKNKAKEIYQYIPDFGGFLVKANSEGQPGPQNYGRTHADGANMLADALAPFNGLVMWRAFVYDVRVQKANENFDSSATVDQHAGEIASPDRFKQAYNEFKPLDGKFRNNVILQVKNGPIDFQPREPFSPLFGAMNSTPLMMEFQVTQEYLGQATHLVFLPTLFKETLDADTYSKVKGSLVKDQVTGIAGVANIGNDRNWTGHPFHQSNWYGFGRLAWDPDLSSNTIATEWIAQTFSNEPSFISTVTQMMLSSRESLVNYMTPLGLHHIMGNGHHYGPAPWSNNLPRADWNPVYYHKADKYGLGFNRTTSGTNALNQYAPQVRQQWEDSNSCADEYILWFHHISWNHKMRSGKTLWEELCYRYNLGVDSVKAIQQHWNSAKKFVDEERFNQVTMLLNIQLKEAKWWRDACLSYFSSIAQLPIPAKYEQPEYNLEYYKSLQFPFAPGIGGHN